MSRVKEREKEERMKKIKAEYRKSVNRAMVKKIVLLVVLVLIVTVITVVAVVKNERTEDIRIAVVTDTHVVASSLFTAENYDDYRYSNKMMDISEAIFDTFADELIKDEVDFLLITGDITEYGDRASHMAVTKTLKKLEDNGVGVFVINGNHDIKGYHGSDRLTREEFKELYCDFGYSEAIATKSDTLSYVADIDEKHRLIAIDNIDYTGAISTENKESLSDEHRLWLYDQLDICMREEKIPVIISHKPLVTHFPEVSEIIDNTEEEMQYKELTEYLAKNGAKIGFAGHEHTNDIKTVKFNDKFEYTEVESSCFSFGPPTYRIMKSDGNEINISTRILRGLDKKYVSPFMPEEEWKQIQTDGLKGYGEFTINRVIDDVIEEIIGEDGTLNKPLVDKWSKFDNLYNVFKTDVLLKFFNMPYYKKDANETESLEEIVESYGYVLPETEYKNLTDLIKKYVTKYVEGDEDFGSDLTILAEYSIYSFILLFSDVTESICNELEAIYPEEGPFEIKLNMQSLFDEGKLELFDSNVVPIVVELANLVKNEGLIELPIDINFEFFNNGLGDPGTEKGVHNSIILGTLSGYTKGKFDGVDQYVYDKYVLIGGENGLLRDGFFKKFAPDAIKDMYPSDTEYTILINENA